MICTEEEIIFNVFGLYFILCSFNISHSFFMPIELHSSQVSGHSLWPLIH